MSLDEASHLQDVTEHFKSVESHPDRTLRKGSCETQWTVIKNKFLSLREANKHVVKQTVQNDMTIALQIRRSEMHLSELHRDGTELITNVQIANESREVERRSADFEQRRKIAGEMREESAKAALKLKAIAQRWRQLDNFKDPMGMFDCLNLQKMRIAELMAQKDDLIADLHDALEAADQQYQLDQITKLNDLECMVDRIDCQVEVMKRSYRCHLDILQSTVNMERKHFKDTESNRWDQLYNKLQAQDKQSADESIRASAKYDDEIAELRTKHQEINRATKIRLDRDNDRLQVELETVKADVLLNSEKLAYNFKVLQKRAGENVTVKAQQKRLLARLNEVVLMNREKYSRLKRTSADTVGRLSKEVQKLHGNLVSFSGKSDALTSASSQKYMNVWSIHESECLALLKNVESANADISANYLGSNDAGEIQDCESFREKINHQRPFKYRTRIPSASQLTAHGLQSLDQQNTYKFVLEHLVDITRWLQDKDIQQLLTDTDSAETLIQVDHILNCFGITNMEHLQELVEAFLPTMADDTGSIAEGEKILASRNSSPAGKQEIPDSTNFLVKLRQFVEQFGHEKPPESTLRSPSAKSDDFHPHEVARFWKSIIDVVPEHRDGLWSNLERGMTKYLQVLKRRSKLDADCEFLRKQNSELKFLLLRYLPENATEK